MKKILSLILCLIILFCFKCLDDLYETLQSLENVDYGDWETLERKGIRIQNCAKRLQALGD